MTIKINYVGFWNSFNPTNNMFYNILSRHFNIEISENPDFVICSNRGKPFEYMKYDCVRIMYMGENLSPDFTAFDYVIGFDFLSFGDRYFRLPFAFYTDSGNPIQFQVPSRQNATEILYSKKYFCNFIYHHPSSNGIRELFFKELEKYKPVLSPGDYLNNTEPSNNTGCSWKQKHDILRLSKFTIACDSISYPGFVTEKIVDPFECHSIPIYFGSPLVDKDFNPESFLWCKTESDVQNTINRVIELDNNDESYIEMLSSCPVNNVESYNSLYFDLENFLINIFSQSPETAQRRIHFYSAENHEKFLSEYMLKHSTSNKSIKETLYTIKKKVIK